MKRSGPPHTPANHRRLHHTAGLAVTPFAVDEMAGERQLVSSAVILAEYLNRLVGRGALLRR